MSPNSTARHRSTMRKVALCAAALVVTILPTACGAAYADSGHAGHGTVEVGGADAAEPNDDEDGGDQNDEQSADAEREEGSADEGNAADEDAAGQGEQNDGDDNGRNNEGDDKNDSANGGEGNNGGLDVLGTDCSNSELQPHDGFEKAPRCVETSFGEVAAEEKSPSLLITEAPEAVKANEEFTISVNTRNLVRDRFLGAAAGGYYRESSFLNEDGIQRGHFHTACRMLDSTSEAPDAAPDPEFFLATQDNGGGAAPDTVRITVSGMPQAGTAQCAVWAGDGSHRIPMMQRANQTPAFDAVRITVE